MVTEDGAEVHSHILTTCQGGTRITRTSSLNFKRTKQSPPELGQATKLVHLQTLWPSDKVEMVPALFSPCSPRKMGLEVNTRASTKQFVLLIKTPQLTELQVPGFTI